MTVSPLAPARRMAQDLLFLDLRLGLSNLRRRAALKGSKSMDATRRGFLAGAAAGVTALAGIGRSRATANTTVGFIYVGSKDDFGWNQSHAVAAGALKTLPGITVD